MKSFSRWMLVWLILICEAAMAAGGQMKTAAELVISNAKVWTVDSKLPTAQAVAVFGDRIVAVGSNADIEAWRGTSTQVIDAGGKLLLPGFNDAHVHFVSGGRQLDAVDLNEATGPKELVGGTTDRAKKPQKDEWTTGEDWDKTNGRRAKFRR